jgi:hypothetical protein
MATDHTREVMTRYWNSDHRDVSMMAKDVGAGGRLRASAGRGARSRGSRLRLTRRAAPPIYFARCLSSSNQFCTTTSSVSPSPASGRIIRNRFPSGDTSYTPAFPPTV